MLASALAGCSSSSDQSESPAGIGNVDMVDGVQPVNRADLPGFVDGFDQIWHW